MKKMQVAFYKGTTRVFNRGVSWWLNGPYSHCELVFHTIEGVSLCASSSFMDGGVRFKYIKLDPNHWDLVDVWVDEQKAMAWMHAHDGDGYDILGLGGFIWRPVSGDKALWFCSEAIAAMLGYSDPHRFDPMVLWAALTRIKQFATTEGALHA